MPHTVTSNGKFSLLSLQGRRVILTAAFAFFLLARMATMAEDDKKTSHPDYYTWKPILIGAGGWLTGIDIAPDGTKVVRADTYGAYLWDADAKEWTQLVTTYSMPADVAKPGIGGGVYEIRIAPSNTKRLFMFYNGDIYRSDDKGSHWVHTSFPSQHDANPNDDNKTCGEKMAVDPINPNVVYVGTPRAGVFVTVDGGTTWKTVRTIPAGVDPGHAGIAFDASSGSIEGKTKIIYIPSPGKGVWRSEDAGATWAQICGGDKNGPLNIHHAGVSSTGIYYVTTFKTQGTDQSGVWKYERGVWVGILPGGQNDHSLAIDPTDPGHIIVGNGAGIINQSFDQGKTWTGGYDGQVKNVATDIPWLAWTNENWRSNGAMQIDPLTHELFFSEGIGVWKATPPKNRGDFNWISQSKGIEQLCPLSLCVPPNGKPVLGSMDRPLFYVDNPDVYPSIHGPNRDYAINFGWSIDYASSDPKFLAAIVNFDNNKDKEESCYSTDGGKTWKKFPTFPNWFPSGNWPNGGCIAVSTPENIIWAASNKKIPCYTTDGGRTWKKISVPGIGDNDGGWSDLQWFNRQFIAADRMTIGTFYLYNANRGLYRSSDGGANWQLVHLGPLQELSNYHAKLKTVPGKAGHLFFTTGLHGGMEDNIHPVQSAKFLHSTDGGADWIPAPDVLEVLNFGFGKEAPGAEYPTIYIAGWVKNEWGIWESDDEAKTWKKIGDYPAGSLAPMAGSYGIDGDKNEYGKVYLGLTGDGWAYGVAPR